MQNNFLRCLAAGLAFAGWQAAASAAPAHDPENPSVWKPRVTRVAVFKNGLGFFLREGETGLRDGWCLSGEIPPAHFGTLAIYSHSPDQLVDVIGAGPGEIVEFDGVDAPADAGAKRARLEASRLLKLQLTYTHKDAERSAAGKLVSVSPEFAVLENEGLSYAVPIEHIRKIQVLERPVRVHVAQDKGKAAESARLGMAYLRKGITWIPEYTLELIDGENATLTLRGTLVNEAEDLVHCDVNFVVGVPHFLHTEYLAPVAVGQAIRTLGAAVAPREVMSQIMNRAAFANDIRANQLEGTGTVVEQPAPGAGRDLREVLGNLPQLENAGGTDFTVYTRKDLTVRRGEKAIVTLFVKKIRYSHNYRWSPPEPLRHFLVLPNQTDSAWTTGPCLAVNQGNPLSEDLLKYVPRGGKGELPVTTAVNLAQDQSETEIDRKLKAHEPAHQFYVDLVTLEGRLTVRNFEPAPVSLVIAVKVPGKPLSASDDGALTVDTSRLQLLERAGSIRWETRVDAGETRTLTYRYERYVPSK